MAFGGNAEHNGSRRYVFSPAGLGMEDRINNALRQLQPYEDRRLTVLGTTTLYELSLRLDPNDVQYIGRNWESMAEKLLYRNWDIQRFRDQKLRAKAIIEDWSMKGLPTIGNLIELVHFGMGRHDIFTDQKIIQCIVQDARRDSASVGRRNPFVLDKNILPSSTPSFPPCIPEVESFFPSFAPESYCSFRTDDMYRPGNVQDSAITQSSSSTLTPVSQGSSDVYLFSDLTDPYFVLQDLLPRLSQAGIKCCLPEDIPVDEITQPNHFANMLTKFRKIVIPLSEQLSTDSVLQQTLGLLPDLRRRVLLVKHKPVTIQRVYDAMPRFDFSTHNIRREDTWYRFIGSIIA